MLSNIYTSHLFFNKNSKMYKGVMVSHVIIMFLGFLLLNIPSDRQVGDTTRGFQNSNLYLFKSLFASLKKKFSIHSHMHIKEAVSAHCYLHNDAIQNTFWATALSTLCSFCDNLFLDQTLWLTVDNKWQVCHWQEIASEPCQQSSKVMKKTPETEKIALKCFLRSQEEPHTFWGIQS